MHTVVPEDKMEEMFEISRALQDYWPGVGGVIEWERTTGEDGVYMWILRSETQITILGMNTAEIVKFLKENKRAPDTAVESKGNLARFGAIEGEIEED